VLIEHGADVMHARCRALSFSILRTAGAGRNRVDWVMRTIETGGSTALMFAARQGDLESANFCWPREQTPTLSRRTE